MFLWEIENGEEKWEINESLVEIGWRSEGKKGIPKNCSLVREFARKGENIHIEGRKERVKRIEKRRVRWNKVCEKCIGFINIR